MVISGCKPWGNQLRYTSILKYVITICNLTLIFTWFPLPNFQPKKEENVGCRIETYSSHKHLIHLCFTTLTLLFMVSLKLYFHIPWCLSKHIKGVFALWILKTLKGIFLWLSAQVLIPFFWVHPLKSHINVEVPHSHHNAVPRHRWLSYFYP